MDVEISQSDLTGTARAPPSKSYTHRAILAAGCSGGALVFDPLISADTKATMRAVEAFGGDVTDTGEAIEIDGFGGEPGTPADVLDCGNSGTTTRLVSGTAALVDGITVLTGDASLRSRPQGPMLSAIEQLDGRAESSRDNGKAPLVIKGPVSGGTVSIPGDVSSQYVSSLLMAGALTEDGVEIELETELKSAPYVDITLELLSDFGVTAKEQADGYSVAGGQFYEPSDGEYHVPGDFSSISYLLAAGAIAAEDGESVQIEGAYPSAQGDTYIVDVLKDMGGDVDWNRNDGVLTVKQSSLSGTTVDVGDTPDLLPTIAALGAVRGRRDAHRELRARPLQGDRPRDRDGEGTLEPGSESRGRGRRTHRVRRRVRPRRVHRGRPRGSSDRDGARRRRSRGRRDDDDSGRRTRRRVVSRLLRGALRPRRRRAAVIRKSSPIRTFPFQWSRFRRASLSR